MSVASSKAKLAGLVAHRDPADPAITEAKRELFRAKARATVATWRGLTTEERAELAVLLLSGGGDAT